MHWGGGNSYKRILCTALLYCSSAADREDERLVHVLLLHNIIYYYTLVAFCTSSDSFMPIFPANRSVLGDLKL